MAESSLSTLAGAVAEFSRVGAQLVESLLGEPCKAAGAMMADQIYFWQWRNRLRIAELAERMMRERQTACRIVPPDFLLPLLEGAGNVENPELQEMWAQLLAAGVAQDDAQHPAFIEALKRMSGSDARLLRGIVKQNGPVSLQRRPHFLAELGADQHSIGRLLAIGILEETPFLWQGSSMAMSTVPRLVLTRFGVHFCQTVMPEVAVPATENA